MKINLLSLVLGLSFALAQAFAQNHQGPAANRFIQGSDFVRFGEKSNVAEFVQLRADAQLPASQFPLWAKKAFKLDANIGFVKLRDEVDNIGMQHSQYQVTNNGKQVFGAFAYTHGRNDMVASFNGKLPTNIGISQPALTEANALQYATDYVDAESYKWQLPGEEAHLKWETNDAAATYFPKGELVYINPSFDFKKEDGFRLAYMFDIYAHKPVGRYVIFVDALSGEVLFKNNRICSADVVGTAVTGYSGTKSITTDSFNGSFRLREAGRGNGVRTLDMNQGTTYGNAVDFTDTDNNWNNANAQYDQYATDAHWGAEMTYDYFLNEHGRNGIDGNNMLIYSYVHYDAGYDNAFWDGQRMTYGDGSGNPLVGLDVCGHEMAHGVTENSAGLVYQDESGALNESFSDIFGASVEFKQNPASGDWIVGEDVGAFRSMSNPNQYGDPDTYTGNNWATGTADNGGVHTNSGVQNKWYYILVQGENGINDLGNAYSVTGIGLDDAQAIAYRNLTVYLGASSTYADARFYSIQSAIDIFGGCSPQVIATTNAWHAVGVGDVFDPTVVGNFSASITSNCLAPATISFSNLSTNGSSFSWDFGDGATSTAVNPTHTYSAFGNYTVSLMVDGDNCGTASVTRPNYISLNATNPCVAAMPNSGGQTLTWCTGTLYDNGGPAANYQDNDNVTTTISPPSATSVTLNFSSFAFEEGYDYLYIYNGPTTNSPLLGQYDGFNLPNGGTVSSTGGSITIRMTSDVYLSEAGFALTWQCTQPNSPPTAIFAASVQETCNGEVSFADQSINGATSWLWNFGDGNTSTAQNPTHTYQNEGTYSVTLTATNGFGSSVVSQNNYITVERPDGPAASGNFRCDAGVLGLSANGTGTLKWYSQPTGGLQVATGANFTTPSLNITTTYYVENEVLPATHNVGPTTNTIGTGGNFEGNQHLLFDALDAFTLKTVKVYAQGAGSRTIQLRSNTGTVLQSTTVNVAAGTQVVTLNFDVQPGNNYQLGTSGVPNLYRNNAGTTYPYTVQNIVSIVNSSAGTDYYYHFYDWVIETKGCISERTAVVAEIAAAPLGQNASRCGTGTVALAATGSGDLEWFDAAIGGNAINSGTSFNTPAISTTTSYYVESEILPALVYGGPATNAFGTGGNFNNVQSLLFDSYQPSTLVSVKVYAQGAANRTIELRNASGTVLQSTMVNIPNGESRVTLNFNLPVGTDLQLGTSAAPNLYRNNTGPSYPYAVSDVASITSSTAGTDFYYFFYDWEVQKAGCTTARTEVIAAVNPTPTVSVSGNTEVCEGESVQITTTATDADAYTWSNGASTAAITVSPTGQETYSVTVSNACGNATDELTIDVNPLPTVSVSDNQEICEGESVELSGSGAGEIIWQPNGETTNNITVSPTSTSTFTFLASNNCGTASENVEVVVNALPTQPIVSVNGSELEATSGANYQWYLDGQLITNATSSTYSPIEAGDYTVEVFDAHGCSSISDPYTWITVGIAEHANCLSIYPNPMQSVFTIKSQNPIVQLLVYDLQGRLVLDQSPNHTTVVVPISELANGVYQLKVLLGDSWFSEKLIKQ